MTELQLQSMCYQWAHNTYPQLRKLLFHVPNGGTRNKIEGMQLKASGVVPGIPDLICLWGAKPVGIEMKTETGNVSDAQEEVHKVWICNGIEVYVIRSFESFKNLIHQILNIQQ